MFCDSDDISTDETKHSNTAFIKNNYSTGFIERNTYVRPKDSSNNSYTTTATIPYVRRTSETIARLLRPYNIRVARKPMFTLRRLLTNVKGKDVPGAVYKIECSDCQATYIGETGRNLTRLNEDKRAAKRVTSTTTSLKTTQKQATLSTVTLLRFYATQYRLLSTNYTRKLVYKLRTNCPKSSSTSSRTLQTITHQETVIHCLLFILQPICA